MIHTIKGFGIINKAEIDVFLELSCFYHDPADVGNLISVVDVTGDRSKVRCCKEQYCIGTWNVRSMNQGSLEVVKQEMARVNIDILIISELKYLEWVNLIRMTVMFATVCKNPLEEME